MKPIAQRLFEELERVGLTAYRVAKISGVAQPTFTKYRKDGMQPTREVLDKICAAFPFIDRSYIEFGTRNPDMENPESFAAVHTDDDDAQAQYPDMKVTSILSDQIRQQQKIIDHLVTENKALMEMLQAKLAERVV